MIYLRVDKNQLVLIVVNVSFTMKLHILYNVNDMLIIKYYDDII